jgi:hypothetical protein
MAGTTTGMRTTPTRSARQRRVHHDCVDADALASIARAAADVAVERDDDRDARGSRPTTGGASGRVLDRDSTSRPPPTFRCSVATTAGGIAVSSRGPVPHGRDDLGESFASSPPWSRAPSPPFPRRVTMRGPCPWGDAARLALRAFEHRRRHSALRDVSRRCRTSPTGRRTRDRCRGDTSRTPLPTAVERSAIRLVVPDQP